MSDHSRPVILVSKCLGFAVCRYDAQELSAPFMDTLAQHADLIPLCPEVEMGMGIPRDPIRLVEQEQKLRLLQSATQKDMTPMMERFLKTFNNRKLALDGAILKAKSPSCGTFDTKVFPAIDNSVPKRLSSGMFSAHLQESHPHIAIEDEGRINNRRLREHFLTRTFLMADFRRVVDSGKAHELVKFQAKNKLLFMGQGQKHTKNLGQIVAKVSDKNFKATCTEYLLVLSKAFARPARAPSHVNVLMHALGYFKKQLGTREKNHFLKALEKYREEKDTLTSTLSLLQSWCLRFDERYISSQTYLEPFPVELVNFTDSGVSRKL